MANHDDRWRDESGQRQRGWRGQEHDDDNERSTRNFGDRFSRDSPTRDRGFADDEDSYGIRARGYRGGSQGASGHDDDFGRGGSWGRGQQDDDWGGTARGGQYRQPGGERQFGAQGGHAGQGERGGYGYGGGGSYSGSSSGYGGGYGARDRSGSHDRGFLERAGDEIASWFGDEDAARRREADHRGRGPADYTRSDERIREDANDRLTDDPRVDARHVSVMVKDGELTLNGTVPTRDEKRRAEDCVEHISGVKHVQNNLRVQQQGAGMASTSGMSTGAGASGPSGLGGVASGGSAGASATGATPPPNGNGSGGSGASRGGSATT